jgi:hypothetical protein
VRSAIYIEYKHEPPRAIFTYIYLFIFYLYLYMGQALKREIRESCLYIIIKLPTDVTAINLMRSAMAHYILPYSPLLCMSWGCFRLSSNRTRTERAAQAVHSGFRRGYTARSKKMGGSSDSPSPSPCPFSSPSPLPSTPSPSTSTSLSASSAASSAASSMARR